MQVIIKNEAEVCVNKFNVNCEQVDWSISIIFCNSYELCKSFF